MIKHLFALVKIFFLLEFAIGLIVLATCLFFGALSYFLDGDFRLELLWRGLKGGSYGAILASLILWFFYYLLPRVCGHFIVAH